MSIGKSSNLFLNPKTKCLFCVFLIIGKALSFSLFPYWKRSGLANTSQIRKKKIIKDKKLISRKERIIPYITGTLYYAVAVYHVIYTHEPQWLVMFFAGGALACLVSTIVNLWWKISAHMAGMGGLLALLWQIDAMNLEVVDKPHMMIYILIAIFLCGLLGTARLLLKRHTLPQIIAGFLNGLICVSLMMRLFG